MRNFVKSFMFLMMIVFLAACGTKSKEDIVNDARNKIDDVQIYDVAMELNFTLNSPLGEETSGAKLSGIFDEENLDFDIKTTESNGAQTYETHMYKLDDVAYVSENDSDWMKLTGDDIQESANNTSYANVMEAVDRVRDLVELETKKDVYHLSFDGSDKKMFEAFESPFSLTFTGFDIEDADFSLEVNIDKKSLFIESLIYTIDVTHGEESISMIANVEYKDINDTEIVIPDEVIDNAVEQ